MKRNIERIIVHERYHFPAKEYDIAVVQLSSSVTFTDEIRRVCLPEASVSFQPNSTVYVTGFGALFHGGGYPKMNHGALSHTYGSVI